MKINWIQNGQYLYDWEQIVINAIKTDSQP